MKQISLKYIWIWADLDPNLPDLVQTPVSYLSSKTGGQHPARNVSEQSSMHISWLLNLMQNTQKDNDLKNKISLKCHLQISKNLLCWLVRDSLNNWLNEPHSRMQSLAPPPDLQHGPLGPPSSRPELPTRGDKKPGRSERIMWPLKRHYNPISVSVVQVTFFGIVHSTRPQWNAHHSISTSSWDEGGTAVIKAKQWLSLCDKKTLAFYVNARSPFQTQLSQVKHTHPPRVLLLSLPHGRRGAGEAERERERKIPNHLNPF